MKIETAIKKAIEGGWKGAYIRQFWVSDDVRLGSDNNFELTGVFLDPLFWQALGKAMGWGDTTGKHYEGEKYRNGKPITKCSSCGNRWPYGNDWCWLYHWHRFIDHLAEGKTAEDFFNLIDL